jgi:hypothetical protein
MPLACIYCIVKYGLKGSELDKLPKTEKELIEHIEKVHHMPVIRKGETLEEAEKRFIEKYPEAINCECCKKRRANWTINIKGGN